MQFPTINGMPVANTAQPTTRQQVELAQGNGPEQGNMAASVLPNSPTAVAAVNASANQQASQNATQQKKSTQQELQDSLKQLNDVAKMYSSKLEFSVDKETNIQVVKVVDQETHQVIRQIPSEDAIRIAKAIDDFKGLLLKDKA